MKISKAIFLDRDGTINLDPGYLGDPNQVQIYSNAIDSLKLLKKKYSFKLIVISNQAGIARGLLSHQDVQSVNSKINEFFISHGTSIDDFFYCPYHPGFDLPKDFVCRKPSPLMILKAVQKHNINLNNSFMIGDMESDILAGNRAGVRSILIKHDLTDEEIISLSSSAVFKTNNFISIVNYIKENI